MHRSWRVERESKHPGPMAGQGDGADVRAVATSLFSGCDEGLLDYICGILEDEHFEFGDEGEEAFEAIGPFLVRVWSACAGLHVQHAWTACTHTKGNERGACMATLGTSTA